METKVEFWGVRGSIAQSSSEYISFGGNTSCVSVTHKDNLFIFDAGTGLKDLGEQASRLGITQATLVLSHAHFDHIIGLPFFKPIWSSNFHLTIVSAHFYNKGGIKHFLESYVFSDPLFPVPLCNVPAKLEYIDCNPQETRVLPQGIELCMAPLNHPGGSTGYRLNCDHVSVAYLSDTEHNAGQDDFNVLKLMQSADLAIYDATYTEEEYRHKKGWGHSTWQEGVRLAQMANAKRLALYHHEPFHTDEMLNQIEIDAQKQWPRAFVARQGMTIVLP